MSAWFVTVDDRRVLRRRGQPENSYPVTLERRRLRLDRRDIGCFILIGAGAVSRPARKRRICSPSLLVCSSLRRTTAAPNP